MPKIRERVRGLQNCYLANWADVNCKLQDKKEKGRICPGAKGGRCISQMSYHNTISQSCIRVGLQMKEMLAMIQHYAILDELPHANLLPLIQPGRSQDLMRRLNDDFCNIPLIVPAEEVFQTSLMVIILEVMIYLS